MSSRYDFIWPDGERIVRFGDGALVDLPSILQARGLTRYVLVSTRRSRMQAATLTGGERMMTDALLHVDVPPGHVPQAAAAVSSATAALARPDGERQLTYVALGGGSVIDTAKAVASARGGVVVAVPTTLSGAEMSGIHRLLQGANKGRPVRPQVVFAVPQLMASMGLPRLAASAMNAMAHAVESLYGPTANPIIEMTALESIRQIAGGLPPASGDTAEPHAVSLGSVMAGYALDSSGYAVHHALCQTIVRVANTPHAETNAIILPRVMDLIENRAPRIGAALAAVLAAASPAGHLAGGIARPGQAIDSICRACNVPQHLHQIGFDPSMVDLVIQQAAARPEMAYTPGGMTATDISELLRAAI